MSHSLTLSRGQQTQNCSRVLRLHDITTSYSTYQQRVLLLLEKQSELKDKPIFRITKHSHMQSDLNPKSLVSSGQKTPVSVCYKRKNRENFIKVTKVTLIQRTQHLSKQQRTYSEKTITQKETRVLQSRSLGQTREPTSFSFSTRVTVLKRFHSQTLLVGTRYSSRVMQTFVLLQNILRETQSSDR